MTSTHHRTGHGSWFTLALLGAFLTVQLLRGWNGQTQLLVLSSFLMFGCCFASAAHLLGVKAALRFALIALPIGWFAEQMGSSHGWFFGKYTYTDVLGPRIGDVPLVIPLMWFALGYCGYVIANLIAWQTPSDGVTPVGQSLTMSFLAALVITAYDLGVDPYMVYKLKAWEMEKKDGWWFGETLQGFVGWMLIALTIVFLFRLSLRKWPPRASSSLRLRDVQVPLAVYGGLMVFQITQGFPVETRTIATFVMGIPLFCAILGLQRWNGAVAPRAEAA